MGPDSSVPVSSAQHKWTDSDGLIEVDLWSLLLFQFGENTQDIFITYIYSTFFSPNSVDTLGVLTVSVKGRCLIEVLRIRVRLIRCYLQYIHASRNPRSAFRLRRLAKSAWPRRVPHKSVL